MAESNDVKDEELEEPTPIGMENVMESMTRITFCGLGGTIVGLSLEKRLESMKITTAEGVAAAARRKRGRIASSQRPSLPLSVTWAISCMVFCSIIEVSRLASPSTWIATKLDLIPKKTPSIVSERGETDRKISAAISVSDYSIGGSIAGVVCSFGRRMYAKKSVVKMPSSRRFSGLLPGLAVGVAAGFIQSSIDYGSELLKDYSNNGE